MEISVPEKYFELATFVTSDVVCIDPEVGEELGEYLAGVLKGGCLERFELHLLDCLACQIDAGNFRSLENALTGDS